MNYSVFRFTLNMHSHRSQASVPVFKGDTGVRLIISLSDGGNPYLIEEGCIAVLSGTKPDLTKLYNQCLLENSIEQNGKTYYTKIVYDFTEQTTSCGGVTNCEIILYGADGNIVTAPKFVIVVDEREVGQGDLTLSETEQNALDLAMSAAAGEEARVSAEAERKTAEDERKLAEARREEAKGELSLKVAHHEKRITNLEQGLPTDLFESDSTIAYRKDVPSDACPYAEVLRIGGMTRRCENLIPYPYFMSSTKISGVTITILADGGISVSGTSTESVNFGLWHLIKGEFGAGTYTISGGTSDIVILARKFNSSGSNVNWIDSIGSAKSGTLTAGESVAGVNMYISSGKTVNATVYPMFNYGTTAKPYEPYFTGLRNAVVTNIKSFGANLIPYPYATGTTTQNGVTITVNSDGFIHFSGTCTSGFEYYIARNLPISSSACAVGTGKEYVTNGEICVSKQGNTLGNAASLAYYTWSGGVVVSYLHEGVTYSGGFYPMINYGTEPAPYKPYSAKPIDTFEIPEEIQSLPGYGLGVDIGLENETYSNEIVVNIETNKKEYREYCEKLIINGTDDGGRVPTSDAYKNCWCIDYRGKPRNRIMMGVTDKYKNITSLSGTDDGAYLRLTGDLLIRDARFTDTATARDILSKNPVTVVLAFQEPIVTDVSDKFPEDNFIKVEGGGYLTFENTNNLPSASTIMYQIKEA